ncbi:MAG: hypothetical protein ACPGN3_15140 [Opitutales bacterium]
MRKSLFQAETIIQRVSVLLTRVSLGGLILIGSVLLAEMSMYEINHPHDRIIHGWTAESLIGEAIDRTGRTDVSPKITEALEALFELGGGSLYLPAGKYRLNRAIRVPPGVGLRGDFVIPGAHPVDPALNTIFCVYYGRGMAKDAKPLVLVDGSSLIDGIVFWYPEQRASTVVEYAPTIRHARNRGEWAINGATRNVFFVNAYTGIQFGINERATCIQLAKNIYGTPLSSGIEVWSDADIPRLLDIDFRPDYWAAAGLDNQPVDFRVLKDYLIENAVGIYYRRSDGSALANIKIRGYNIGMKLADGHYVGKHFINNEGHYINFDIRECRYAVWLQNTKNHGTQFYGSTLSGTHSGLYIENPVRRSQNAMFMKTLIEGGVAAITQEWAAEPNDLFTLKFSACEFGGTVNWTGGNLMIANSKFYGSQKHLHVGPKVNSVVVADSQFSRRAQIENLAGDKLQFGGEQFGYVRPPDYSYDTDKINDYRPSQNETLYVSPIDDSHDDSPRIQAAIDQISQVGGGYVVVMPGHYTLRSAIEVKANVELRGSLQSWQHSKFFSHFSTEGTPKGPILFVEHAQGNPDLATFVLKENAGIDGLLFHYPGQRYDEASGEVLEEYGWLIRMAGENSYVKHVTASNPWRFIDSETVPSNNIYIGYCNGAPLDTGVLVGESENAFLDNVHFNSWYWNTVYYDNKPSKFDEETKYKAALDNWMKANTNAFVFAGSKNLEVYGSFIFCAKQAFTLMPGKRSGVGPSGILANSGCDWSKFGLYMYANNDLTFLNTHFITVTHFDDDPSVSSIYVAEGCNDSIAMFNTSTWGSGHRLLSLHGTADSYLAMYNVSYQQYYDQDNIVNAGKVALINLNRNIPKRDLSMSLGDQAYIAMRSNVLGSALRFSAKNPVKEVDGFFLAPEFRRKNPNGVAKSFTYEMGQGAR